MKWRTLLSIVAAWLCLTVAAAWLYRAIYSGYGSIFSATASLSRPPQVAVFSSTVEATDAGVHAVAEPDTTGSVAVAPPAPSVEPEPPAAVEVPEPPRPVVPPREIAVVDASAVASAVDSGPPVTTAEIPDAGVTRYDAGRRDASIPDANVPLGAIGVNAGAWGATGVTGGAQGSTGVTAGEAGSTGITGGAWGSTGVTAGEAGSTGIGGSRAP